MRHEFDLNHHFTITTASQPQEGLRIIRFNPTGQIICQRRLTKTQNLMFWSNRRVKTEIVEFENWITTYLLQNQTWLSLKLNMINNRWEKCFHNRSNVWLSNLPLTSIDQTKVLRKQKLSFDTQLSLSQLTKENGPSMNLLFQEASTPPLETFPRPRQSPPDTGWVREIFVFNFSQVFVTSTPVFI